MGEGILENTQDVVVSRSEAQISARLHVEGEEVWSKEDLHVLARPGPRDMGSWREKAAWAGDRWGALLGPAHELLPEFSTFLCNAFLLTVTCRLPMPAEARGPCTGSCPLTSCPWGAHLYTLGPCSPPAPCTSSFSRLHRACAQGGPGQAGEFAPQDTALCPCSQESRETSFGGTILRCRALSNE